VERSSFKTNLKSLECFRAIIDTGSATAAATQLGLTQPAVSRLLSQLEQRIGFVLFQRRKGRLLPTGEALALYQEVDIALQSVDRVSQLARNLQDADYGELTIVSPPSFAHGVLSGVIADFIERYPRLRVSLDSSSVETARDMVALRAVDCGFVKLPLDYPGIDCRTLVRSGTVCALPEDHRLCRQRTVSARSLRGEPLVLLGKGRASRAQIDEAFRKAGAEMKVRIETHTVGSACAFARRGVGIAIINELLALPYSGKGLELRRFSPNIKHEYAFMTSSAAPMNRVTQRFYDHCSEYFTRNRAMLHMPRRA
jgi:DNA-binding transcriptional LysR family regulator